MIGRTVVSLVFVFVGCAEPASLPEPGTGYETLEKFCQARARAECSAAVVDACESGSVELCVGMREDVCLAATPQGTTYVPANAPACIALAHQVYAEATITKQDAQALSSACGTLVFTGPGVARAPCTTDLDCDTASGLSCILPAAAYPGTNGKCLVPRVVPNGGSCAGEADRCGSEAFCDFSTKVCTPAAPVGEFCLLGAEGACVAGSECRGGGVVEPPKCFALAPAGAPCTEDADCAHGLCDRLASNGKGSCTAKLEMLSIAASCQGFKP